VFLYDGATHALISALTGSTAGDRVGFDGLTLLSNGNFLVFSQSLDVVGYFTDNTAAAAIINLTLTGTSAAGYGTAYKSGVVRPETSIVSADGPGLSVANAAVVQLAAGKIDLFNDEATHVLVDVTGCFT
jgi:hypothetical protein